MDQIHQGVHFVGRHFILLDAGDEFRDHFFRRECHEIGDQAFPHALGCDQGQIKEVFDQTLLDLRRA